MGKKPNGKFKGFLGTWSIGDGGGHAFINVCSSHMFSSMEEMYGGKGSEAEIKLHRRCQVLSQVPRKAQVKYTPI